MTPKQSEFLEQYLSTLSQAERAAVPAVIAEHFCADEYHANECARLIGQGIKTATCSLKEGYVVDDEPLPQIGRLSVVLNWNQEPVCIVKVTSVAICAFDKVTPEFAFMEGEGDRSYPSWRTSHINFFQSYASQLGLTFTTDDDLVLETFEKVYPVGV